VRQASGRANIALAALSSNGRHQLGTSAFTSAHIKVLSATQRQLAGDLRSAG